MKKLLTLAVLAMMSTNAMAVNKWYHGKVTRIYYTTVASKFVFILDSGVLDDCKYNYAYVSTASMSEQQVEAFYSMALSAFHTDTTLGVVIDKPAAGEICNAVAMDIQK